MNTLLVLVLIIIYLSWIYSRAHTAINQWAISNSFEILELERRDVFTGPFFLKNYTKKPVYYIRVRQNGTLKSGYVRCGGPWLCFSPDDIEVRWDDKKIHSPLVDNSSIFAHFKRNLLIKTGAILLVLGSGPLFLIIWLSKDPNPNPIGPGIFAGLTFPLSVILLGIGTIQVFIQYNKNKNS